MTFVTLRQRSLLIAALVVCSVCVSEAYATRQFYTKWKFGPDAVYRYSIYYFKAHRNATGFQHHYAIFYEQQPDYIFYYDPLKKEYWGRALRYAEGLGSFSVIDRKHRSERLAEIGKKAFPEAAGTPPIPGAEDGVAMLLPFTPGALMKTLLRQKPTDLPDVEALPRQANAKAANLPPPGGNARQQPRTFTVTLAKPIPPKPVYRNVTRYEVEYIPRVRYVLGYSPFGRVLVPQVYYKTRLIPITVRERIR